MNKKTVVSSVILYLASSAISFVLFTHFVKPANTQSPSDLPVTQSSLLDIAPDAPKTEVCPINGQKYTTIEKQAWDKRRPLTVMIENHGEARPQSGLGSSDVVYEALAEGGVTRFMAIFYCGAQANDILIAPVRSARVYFMDWASEYGGYPLYVHVGGANCSGDPGGPCKSDPRVQALELIQKYGWGGKTGNDINQFSVGYPTFYRDYNRLDHEVATEHTMVSSTEKLWNLAKDRGWTNLSPKGADWLDAFTPWKFQDGVTEADRGDVSTISFDFWDGYKEYDVRWDYDKAANVYKRSNGGEPHLDLNSGKQLTTSNAVILFTKEIGPVDQLKHMYYETIGKGKALIFQNGQVIKGNWSKASRTARTIFTDDKGKEIQFVRGRIWISAVSNDTNISY